LPAAVLLGVAVVLWRRAPWVTVAVVTFTLGAVTTLGLIPYDYQVYSTVADRYAYLSMLGPALALAYFVRGRGSRAFAAAVGVLAACAVLTAVQCTRWADNATLFNYTLRHNPRSLVAYRSLAFDANAHGRPDDVLEFSRRGLEVRPGDAVMLQWVGNIAMQRGRFDEAAAAFGEAAKTAGPRRAETLSSLGAALAQSGRLPEAEAAFQQAVKEDPKFGPAYENLGILNAQRRNWDESIRYLSRALEMNPESPRAKVLLPQISAHVAAMRRATATTPTTTTSPSAAPASVTP
jgi:tetratricopeptide (TPR) repeat protein